MLAAVHVVVALGGPGKLDETHLARPAVAVLKKKNSYSAYVLPMRAIAIQLIYIVSCKLRCVDRTSTTKCILADGVLGGPVRTVLAHELGHARGLPCDPLGRGVRHGDRAHGRAHTGSTLRSQKASVKRSPLPDDEPCCCQRDRFQSLLYESEFVAMHCVL